MKNILLLISLISFSTIVFSQGTMTDPNTGITYKTITIGSQTIMAEDLLRSTNTSDPFNAFWTAVDGDITKNVMMKPIPGWHVPSKADWEKLFQFLGNDKKKAFEALNKTDGFNPSFRGGVAANGSLLAQGATGFYWSSTIKDYTMTWNFFFNNLAKEARINYSNDVKSARLCVRLFKD
jgi:uncharacterized protein (TIGR02145 family)